MDNLTNVLLDIDKVHKTLERAMECGPGLGRLNQLYGHSHATPTTYRI